MFLSDTVYEEIGQDTLVLIHRFSIHCDLALRYRIILTHVESVKGECSLLLLFFTTSQSRMGCIPQISENDLIFLVKLSDEKRGGGVVSPHNPL